jgi:hypothetical protein
VVAVFALGCGGSSAATGGSKPGGGATVSRPTATANSTTPSNASAGTPSSSAGSSTPAGAASTPGSTGGAGVAAPPPGTGVAPPPVAGAAGMAAMAAAAPPAPVIVDPADVAACSGTGAPPDTNEQVDVIQIRTSDVVPGGFAAPDGTTYACFWTDIDMPEKKHIIGWEGVVGDRAVHHQQVSISEHPFYLTQQGGLCGLPTVDFTWTGEKPTEWTPKLAGYPVGGPENGGKAHFLWQTHFESATMYVGGFNVYVTKNLRKYDAGNFEQGDVAGIDIKPMSAATHVATCTPDMTMKKLPNPIYVYASMQHAHLTITHIKTEQQRAGQTIKVLGDQSVMGFLGFFDQQFQPWTPCIEIDPGDQLVTTCDYMNNFNFEVTGGESTTNEMCTTFMEYFPRLPAQGDNFCGTIDSSGGFLGM